MADPGWQTAAARQRAGLRGRLLTPLPHDGFWGWVLPLLVTFAAGVMRFHRLGTPGGYVFDEVYYADEAHDLLRYGVEFTPKAGSPEFVVHPPVGKWVIAAGQALFGNDAFGWRFFVALFGTLSVLVLARVGRRLFRSTLLGCVAATLMALDGEHFVHSRAALLDLILMVFVLGAFGALLVDRDHARERLASAVERDDDRRWGPSLGPRPWRVLAGLLLGLAVGTKWSGLFFLAAFGLMTVLWDAGARRAAHVRLPYVAALRRDVVPALLSLVLLPFVVYLGSWAGWFHSDAKHAYDRDWAATNPGLPLPAALRSLWHYHEQMYFVHEHLTTFHAYRSNPWGWLILARPVSFFYEAPRLGAAGCRAASCSQAITAIGTPAVWWAGVLAIPVLVVLWAGRRDWRAGAVLGGIAAGYLPWFNYQHRTVFAFYSIAFLPWVVLAVTMVLGLLLGGRVSSPNRRAAGAAVVGAYVLLVLWNFWWLYPVLAAQVIPYASWYHRMWFPSWI